MALSAKQVDELCNPSVTFFKNLEYIDYIIYLTKTCIFYRMRYLRNFYLLQDQWNSQDLQG